MADELVNQAEAEDNSVVSEVTKSDEEQISYESTVAKSIDTLTDVVQSIAESQQGVEKALDVFADRIKALEEKPANQLNPKVPHTASGGDIGVKVDVPRSPGGYAPQQGIQVGLDSDKRGQGGSKPGKDPSGLKMEQKSEEEVETSEPEMVQKSQHTFSTETPRPQAALETAEKSYEKDFSPILKDARENGYEGLNVVAQNILSGKYYKPSPEEIGGF